MKILKSCAVALGFTTLSLTWLLGPILGAGRNELYHWDAAFSRLILPSILDFVLAWAAFTVIVHFALRSRKTTRLLWSFFIVCVPLLELKNYGAFTGAHFNRRWMVAAVVVTLLSAAVVASLALSLPHAKDERWCHAASVFNAGVALSGALCLLLAAFSIVDLRPISLPVVSAADTAVRSRSGPRVIWVLFDELSYRQVYEHRYPGLPLPAFDGLAAQSTLFTNVRPAAFYTEIAVPVLMSGIPAQKARGSGSGSLSMQLPNSSWSRFDSSHTIFQDARDRGYSTAVDGWYNPYCRLLSAVLDHCFWTLSAPVSNGMSPQANFAENLILPLTLLNRQNGLRLIQKFFPNQDIKGNQWQINDYQQIDQHAQSLLADPSVDFLFLHLPVPHPQGIYDRKTGRFTPQSTSYIDNLVLADKFLGRLRATLERNGQWDSTTIVVMGDHSWRTSLWEHSDTWTSTESEASNGGSFDDRPGYIVKLPYQQRGTRFTSAFDAVRTRALLQSIISSRIRSSQDLDRWASNVSPSYDLTASSSPPPIAHP